MKQIIMPLFALFTTISCYGQSTKNQIYGTWQLIENTQTITLQFEQNGELYFIQNDGKYKSDFKFDSDTTIYLGTTLYKISSLLEDELILTTLGFLPKKFKYKKIQSSIDKIEEIEKIDEYFKNGKKKIEGQRRDGFMDGKWTEWYEDGKIKSIQHFNKAYPIGKHQFWHENGVLAEEKEYNLRFQIIYIKRWDKDGKLIYEK